MLYDLTVSQLNYIVNKLFITIRRDRVRVFIQILGLLNMLILILVFIYRPARQNNRMHLVLRDVYAKPRFSPVILDTADRERIIRVMIPYKPVCQR